MISFTTSSSCQAASAATASASTGRGRPGSVAAASPAVSTIAAGSVPRCITTSSGAPIHRGQPFTASKIATSPRTRRWSDTSIELERQHRERGDRDERRGRPRLRTASAWLRGRASTGQSVTMPSSGRVARRAWVRQVLEPAVDLQPEVVDPLDERVVDGVLVGRDGGGTEVDRVVEEPVDGRPA